VVGTTEVLVISCSVLFIAMIKRRLFYCLWGSCIGILTVLALFKGRLDPAKYVATLKRYSKAKGNGFWCNLKFHQDNSTIRTVSSINLCLTGNDDEIVEVHVNSDLNRIEYL